MEVSTELQKRLCLFRELKEQAIRANAKALAEDIKSQREKSKAYSKEVDDEPEHAESTKDDKDYTLEEWKEWSKRKEGKNTKGGYKNLDELAHSTYEKEVSRITIDKERYAKLKGEGAEDVEGLVRGLQEASERRLKKRRTEPVESNSINEKNRQFNLKLERERKR